MKSEVVKYLKGSFKDFEGKLRDVTVCAVNYDPWEEDRDDIACLSEATPDNLDIYRALNIGVAIRNPEDIDDEAKGEKIAYNRAMFNCPSLLATHSCAFKPAIIEAVMKCELQHVFENPGQYIKGYAEKEKRAMFITNTHKEYEELSLSEKIVVDSIREGVDAEKCIDLAKRLDKCPRK